MFRKDQEAINTWSMQKVNECAYIQRNLINQAYKMLKKEESSFIQHVRILRRK